MSVMYREQRFDRISVWKEKVSQYNDVPLYTAYMSEEIPVTTGLIRNAKINEREI